MKQKWINIIVVTNLILLIGIAAYLWLSHGKSASETVYIDLAKVYNEFTYKIEIETMLTQEDKSRRFKNDSLIAVLNEGIGSGLMSPAEKLRLEQEISMSSTKYQEEMRQLTSHYDQLVWNAINKYVFDFGRLNDKQLILGSKGEGNIMYASEGGDISEEVIKFINEAYTNEK